MLTLFRITFEEDTKLQDAGTFTLMKEDHTVGNIIRLYVLSVDLSDCNIVNIALFCVTPEYSSQATSNVPSLVTCAVPTARAFRMPHPLENKLLVKVRSGLALR